MSSDEFFWVTPPEDLIKGIQEYGHKAEAALYAIANKWGQDVQDQTRKNAKWEDRSGNARSGIFFAVDGLGLGTVQGEVSAQAATLMKETSVESGADSVLIITVSHTVFYGKFLEFSHGGRYAIIMSTIEQNLPRLEQLVQGIFQG